MITVNIPLKEDLAEVLKDLDRPIEESARELIVLELYREHKISIGKAAELLEMDLLDFIRYSSSIGIPYLDLPPEQLDRDFAKADEIPSLAAETEALREAYAALNRNDIPATVKAFDPQIEWIEPPEYPAGGTYHGHARVKAHLSQARSNWAEGSCEPERFIVAGDKIIVFAYVRVRLEHEMEWREGGIADVYTFRNGKAIQMRHFPDRQQALEWAGAKASDAT